MHNSTYDNEPEIYSEARKGWMFHEKLNILKDIIKKDTKIVNILEFGSWTWDFINTLSEQYCGIQFHWYDINEKYIEYSTSRFQGVHFSSRLENFLHTEYDYIYINDVIHHFDTEKSFIDTIIKLKFRHLIIIEPNQFNPYILYFQYKTVGERNFQQKIFENLIKHQKWLQIVKKEYKFLFPNFIKKENTLMKFLNKNFQNNKFLWGSVFYMIKNHEE